MSKALIMRESCSAPLCSEGTFQTQLRGERPGPVGDVFGAITLAQERGEPTLDSPRGPGYDLKDHTDTFL